jgi:hypothetical protein
MISENIWNNIITILNNAKQTGQPLEYVKNIYQGFRFKDDLPEVFLPTIVVEPIKEIEENITIPNFKKITFEVLIECILEVINKDDQITANIQGDKGIMDMVADVKNVLNANRDLNGSCLKFTFPETSFIFEIYPYRLADITMRIETQPIQDTNR